MGLLRENEAFEQNITAVNYASDADCISRDSCSLIVSWSSTVADAEGNIFKHKRREKKITLQYRKKFLKDPRTGKKKKKSMKFPQELIRGTQVNVPTTQLKGLLKPVFFLHEASKTYFSSVHSFKNNIYELFHSALSDLLWGKPQQPYSMVYV